MKRIGWVIAILSIVVGAAAGAVGFTLYDQYWAQLPPLDNLLDYRPPVATRVYADDGSLVGEFFFEKRYLTPINNITPLVQNAFIAAEDSDFRSHRGIDPKSIVRAFVANLRAGGVVQGGSTITQQVVKALVLSPERSYKRKLREIMLSLRLEQELTKDEILYLYLNEIYLGDGNYGVGAAARSYFGKAVTELTAGEAALLAGLPQAPSRYSPTRNPAGARSRQLYVLRRMHEEGFIDARQYAEAVREAPPVLAKDEGRYGSGSYYTEYVRQYLGDNYGKQATYHKGFNIYTGMNIAMQRAAEVAVANGINRIDGMLGYRGPVGRVEGKELEERLQRDGVDLGLEVLEENTVYEGVVTRVDGSLITVVVGPQAGIVDVADVKWHREAARREFLEGDIVEVVPVWSEGAPSLLLNQSPAIQAALLAIDPHDGQVKAMVGGYAFESSQFNRATQAKRQPGSAFKPFIYASALDNGYTPASVVLDAPIQYVDHDTIWKPQNYSRRFYGPTPLRRALEKSRNVVTIRIVHDLGVDTVVDYVSKFGFKRPIGRNLSVGLGTTELTLLELVGGYTVFANAGERHEPIFITRVEDARGYILEENSPRPARVISPQTAYLMTSLLRGVIENGTGRGVRALNRPAGGKTGTTNEQRDAWFVGFTPDLVAGIWVGFDDYREIGPQGTGGKIAAPVWLDFMKTALDGRPVTDFDIPEGISCVHIDPDSGLRATFDNLTAKLECFKSGTEPTEFVPLWETQAERTRPSDVPETLGKRTRRHPFRAGH